MAGMEKLPTFSRWVITFWGIGMVVNGAGLLAAFSVGHFTHPEESSKVELFLVALFCFFAMAAGVYVPLRLLRRT